MNESHFLISEHGTAVILSVNKNERTHQRISETIFTRVFCKSQENFDKPFSHLCSYKPVYIRKKLNFIAKRIIPRNEKTSYF